MINNPRHDLIQSYNNHAQQRDSNPMLEWKFPERDRILALFQEEKVQTLLEIGSGTGRDSLFFQEHDLRVTCIDLSPANVSLCREKGLDARVMDMACLNFPARSFDAVYSVNSLLHLPKAELLQVLGQVDSVLKPGGIFYLGIYGGIDFEGIRDEDIYTPKRFFSFYTDEHLQKEVGKVFTIAEFTRIGYPSSNGIYFQSMILKNKNP